LSRDRPGSAALYAGLVALAALASTGYAKARIFGVG
jgi:hypothetical protein